MQTTNARLPGIPAQQMTEAATKFRDFANQVEALYKAVNRSLIIDESVRATVIGLRQNAAYLEGVAREVA